MYKLMCQALVLQDPLAPLPMQRSAVLVDQWPLRPLWLLRDLVILVAPSPLRPPRPPQPLWPFVDLVVIAAPSPLRHPAVIVDRLGQVLEIRY